MDRTSERQARRHPARSAVFVAQLNDHYRVLIKALLSAGENLLLANYFGGGEVYLAAALVAARRSGYLNPGCSLAGEKPLVIKETPSPLPLPSLSLSLSLSLSCCFYLSASPDLSFRPFSRSIAVSFRRGRLTSPNFKLAGRISGRGALMSSRGSRSHLRRSACDVRRGRDTAATANGPTSRVPFGRASFQRAFTTSDVTPQRGTFARDPSAARYAPRHPPASSCSLSLFSERKHAGPGGSVRFTAARTSEVFN